MIPENLKKVTVITHYTDYYPEADEDDFEEGDEYDKITLYDADGNSIIEYGDYYHYKGDLKIAGFIDCLNYLNGSEIEVIEKDERTVLSSSQEDYLDE